MCLISKRRKTHRLKRDMLCWKVVFKFNENDRLKPIYHDRNTEYRLNSTYVNRHRMQVRKYWCEPGTYEVGAGFFHAFISLDRARILSRHLNEMFHPDERVAVVCECVIPAGTKIFYNLTGLEVCARKLRFDKILEL